MSRLSDVAVWAPAEEGRSEGCRAPRPLTWREERRQVRRAADEGEASRARGEGGSERGADGEGRGEAEEGGSLGEGSGEERPRSGGPREGGAIW